jgi:glycosyltransferase involved in cell wall biosynthesis
MDPQSPLVSVILTTRDRPRLFPIALACFEHQTYPHRELIVVDDGEAYPADLSAIEASRVTHVRLPPGTPLGIKLNHGVDVARGILCMKMDDDDWYAPGYLQTSVSALMDSRRDVCMPAVVFHLGFLFFDLATWRLHESADYNAPGATLLFAKQDWRHRPFRPLPTDEDVWFYRDQVKAGAMPLPIDSRETYVAVRHHGMAGTFGHTWTHQLDGMTLEQYLRGRPEYSRHPEQLFPKWALDIYRMIHDELRGRPAPGTVASAG